METKMVNTFKRIVCAVDFSDASISTVGMAIRLASISEGKVAFAHVIHDPWPDIYRVDKNETLDPAKAEKRARVLLERFAAAHGARADCDFYVECILDGTPGRGLASFARFYGADLIIMAKKGDFGRSLAGGFIESVMRRAHCSVLLIRPHEPHNERMLRDKLVLVVDDEPDILETVSEILSTYRIHTASDFESALQRLESSRYDVVILDIMGVNGFALLEKCVELGYPAVMLSAHAVTAEAIKKCARLGAVFFLPKERMMDLPAFIEEVVVTGGRPLWNSMLERLNFFFEKRLGRDWERTKDLIKTLEKDVLG
jgi:nucleotide-binding universal stress UspA family protein